MSCPSAFVRAVAVVVLLSGSSQAQSYVVDDVGPADFSDLQTALDSVPSGSTIVLRRQYNQAVTIDESVTIVSEWQALVFADGYYPSAAAVTVNAADAVVVLRNLRIDSTDISSGEYSASCAAIEVVDAGTVLVDECVLPGNDWQPWRWGVSYTPHPGILVSGRCGTLTVKDSSITGADGFPSSGLSEYCKFYLDVIADRGGDGIYAPNAGRIIVLNSHVEGGRGGDAVWPDVDCHNQPINFPPTTLISGDGGNAIVGNAFISNCSLVAGERGALVDLGAWDVGVEGIDGVVVVGSRVEALEVARVSTDSSGAQADSDSSHQLGISADGTVVAFLSNATNLIPGDLNGVQDAFVRDQLRGITSRVSIGSSGAEADNWSQYVAISGDGNVVAFSSLASNLVTGDTNQHFDVFVHDRSTGTTDRVSVGPAGVEGNESSGTTAIAVSYDGRFVAFESDASNLVTGDTNGSEDVFVRDRILGTTERVSVSSGGGQGFYGGYGPRISADGRYVVFASDSPDLVLGDTNGKTDIFVHDRQAGTTDRVSLPAGLGEANGRSFTSAISDDGRWVTFDSDADNLVANDTNGVMDVFARDRLNGTTIRASVASDGTESNAFSSYPVISGDGRYISYMSPADNLVPNDTGSTDIFRYDVTTGRTSRQSVGFGHQPAYGTSQMPAINFDGEWIAFQSFAYNVVEGDTNGVPDVFLRSAHCVDAAWWNYGIGFPGTLGIPTLTAQVDPLLGTPLSVDLSNSYGLTTLGVVLIGFQDIYLPTKKSGTYLVLPLVSVALTVPVSGVAIDADLDDDDALSGMHIYVQALQGDPGAARGISFTPGLDLLLGR